MPTPKNEDQPAAEARPLADAEPPTAAHPRNMGDHEPAPQHSTAAHRRGEHGRKQATPADSHPAG